MRLHGAFPADGGKSAAHLERADIAIFAKKCPLSLLRTDLCSKIVNSTEDLWRVTDHHILASGAPDGRELRPYGRSMPREVLERNENGRVKQ